MYRIKLIISLLIFAAIHFYSCCKKNPLSPPDIRELTWSVDTLELPDNRQTHLFDVWGSSANNVYVVGIATTNSGLLWRFNGERWYDIRISVSQGGPVIGSIHFEDVFGFSENDVWICGVRYIRNPNPPPDKFRTSLLIHWDGSQWKEITTPDGHMLTAIWGSSPDNIWLNETASRQ